MSVSRRLTRSFGAVLLGPALTAVIQIVNVPVMLRMWGPALYGEWLVISAVPTYLLLTDLGFGNVAGSDMTMRVSAGDHAGALETFQSIAVLMGICSAVLAVVLSLLQFAIPVHRLLHLTAMSPGEAQITFLLLCLNCLVMLQWSVLMAAFRANGRYAQGMFSINCFRIVEAAGFLIILVRHTRPVGLAMLMLLISVAGTVWLVVLQGRGGRPFALGWGSASRRRVRELAPPAFAYLAFPAGAAISTQGMTMIAGLVLGPIAVAAFNPMRTLTRFALQLTDTVKNAFWPELSIAFGRGDLLLARRLHRVAFQISLALGVGALLFLLLAGPRIFALWTHGRVLFQPTVFHLLLATVLANSIWNASSTVPLAANQHRRLSRIYLGVSAVSISLAYALSRRSGLAGVAWGMLFADCCMAVVVIRVSTSLLEERIGAFAAACIAPGQAMEVVGRCLRRMRSDRLQEKRM